MLCLGLFSFADAAENWTDSGNDVLKRLVSINSGTKNLRGVNEIQSIIATKLQTLGFQVSFKPNPNGNDKSGELLVATLKGSKPGYITLVLHADTVFEPSVGGSELKIPADGSQAVGPGAIDEKGSIVVALSGLEQYLSKKKPLAYSLRVVSSPSEETGSEGFLDDFRSFSADSVMVLGFEPSLDNGSIVSSRKGNRWYHIKVAGTEAHAGRTHKDGANACDELAIKLVELRKLTDYSRGITLSTGRIDGGKDKFNIVCGFAQAKVDTRFADMENRDLLHQSIEKILSVNHIAAFDGSHPTKTEYALANDSPPLSEDPISRPWIAKYVEIVNSRENGSIQAAASGGSSDLNYFGRKGLVVIDGLGARGGNMHTAEEFIHLPSLRTRSEALAEFLRFAQTKL
jgi:glutamate carboxypeptidase